MFLKKKKTVSDEWEFDAPIHSSFDDDEPMFFESPILKKPSFFTNRHLPTLSVSVPFGYSMVGLVLGVVVFGIFGSFYTSFKKPTLLSYQGWLDRGYVSGMSSVMVTLKKEDSQIPLLPKIQNNLLGVNNETTVIQQNLEQAYLASNRVTVPQSYQMMQTEIISAINSELTVLSDFTKYESTNSGYNTFLASLHQTNRQINWLNSQWNRVK